MKYKPKRLWIIFLISSMILLSSTDAITASKTMNQESNKLEKATFAGGCFWCTESDFEKVDGVVEAISGYIGGRKADPSYEEVSAGGTGHAEAVQILYDPSTVTYRQLLDVFWRHIDPTDPGGQFVDRGSQYRSAIFYHDDQQRRQAETSKVELGGSGRFNKPIVTEIVAVTMFYPAEEYHQNYYRNHSLRYRYYRYGSGRDQFLKSVWSESDPTAVIAAAEMDYPRPSDDLLKKKLTPLQYQVTQHDGTEPPFRNEFWDNKKAGIYVDIVSGEPLFSSTDKFESGTGWPSFTQPLEEVHIVEKTDRNYFMIRTEIRSRYGDSHLGHLFPDGPPPTGLRYCINSASLRFVPEEKLEESGYGQYRRLFEVTAN